MLPGILIEIIFLIYYLCRPRIPVRMNRTFLGILLMHTLTVLFNYISTRADEQFAEHSIPLLYILNIAFFVFYLLRIYWFYLFTTDVLLLKDSRFRRIPAAGAVCIISVLITLSSPLTHAVFSMDEAGYHKGFMYNILYICFAFYLVLALWYIFRYRSRLSVYELLSLLGYHAVLLAGNIARFMFPTVLIMNLFCLMAIIVIYLSFENPDLYLSMKGAAFNLDALIAVLNEKSHSVPCRILGFVIRNYNDERVIYGSSQIDRSITLINRYLSVKYPDVLIFYLRNGTFGILGSETMDCAAMCEEINERFRHPWIADDTELYLSVAFVQSGSNYMEHSTDRIVSTLLAALDNAGQSVVPAGDQPVAEAIQSIDEQMDIKKALEKALEEYRVEVFLQPLIDSKSGKVIAAEALARIRDENNNLIPPGLFIPIAEKNGHINDLGEQVFIRVCRFIRDNNLDALGLSWINVNLSPIQCMSNGLAANFSRILKEYNIPASRIHLEITEQSMVDYSLIKTQIDGLSSSGFRLSLDDYGSGYFNLTRVKRYPFKNIKIDMEIVWDYFNARDHLLPTLIHAFKEMNFTITAEGIENREMADEFRRIGCDYLQGYYYSKPLPITDFLRRYGGA